MESGGRPSLDGEPVKKKQRIEKLAAPESLPQDAKPERAGGTSNGAVPSVAVGGPNAVVGTLERAEATPAGTSDGLGLLSAPADVADGVESGDVKMASVGDTGGMDQYGDQKGGAAADDEDEDEDADHVSEDVKNNEDGEDGSESDLSEEPSSDDGGSDFGDDAAAFLGEITARLSSGSSMMEAVRTIFSSSGDENGESGTTVSGIPIDQPVSGVDRVPTLKDAVPARLSASLAEPILQALEADPALARRPRDVAQLCAAVYHLSADDLHAAADLARPRLDLSIESLNDIAAIVEKAQNIVVLSGAGVSVSCGIPDFRSKDGVYEKVLERYGLSDPQAIFDLDEFRLDPTLFFSFAKDIMPSNDIQPSATHRFIAELDKRDKLLRNYSQNIDGLEHRAGISAERVILCHGSFLTATCMRPSCRYQVSGSSIAPEVLAGNVPRCERCKKNEKPNKTKKSSGNDGDESSDDDVEWSSVVKPDIVFFGENLPKSVSETLERDIPAADLVLVLGTSLKVAPVALIPQQFPNEVPRMLVNRELVGCRFDIELLGNCDAVVEELQRKLMWTAGSSSVEKKKSENEDDVDAGEGSSAACATAESKEDKPQSRACNDVSKDERASPLYEFRPPRRFMFPGAIEDSEAGRSSDDDEEEEEAPADVSGAAGPSGLASIYETKRPSMDDIDALGDVPDTDSPVANDLSGETALLDGDDGVIDPSSASAESGGGDGSSADKSSDEAK